VIFMVGLREAVEQDVGAGDFAVMRDGRKLPILQISYGLVYEGGAFWPYCRIAAEDGASLNLNRIERYEKAI